jgi:hypothetical protein
MTKGASSPTRCVTTVDAAVNKMAGRKLFGPRSEKGRSRRKTEVTSEGSQSGSRTPQRPEIREN